MKPLRLGALIAFACGGCANDYSQVALVADGGNAGAATSGDAGSADGGGGRGGSGGAGSVGGSAVGGRGGASSGSAGAGAGPIECRPGTVGDLVDEFEGAGLSAQWMQHGGNANDVERSGGLVTIQPGPMGGDERGIKSSASYPLGDCSVHVEVVTPPSADPVGLFLDLRADPTHFVRFGVYDGEITFRIDDGSPGMIGGTLFDPVAHRWLRLRGEGNSVHFDTSPDGLDWTSMHNRPRPAFVSDVEVWIWTYSFEVEPMADVIEIDNVNFVR